MLRNKLQASFQMHYHWSIVRGFWNYILSNRDKQGRGRKQVLSCQNFVTNAHSNRHQIYHTR